MNNYNYIASYPKKIYLQADEDEPHYYPHDTTWADHEIGHWDVAYIREDIRIQGLSPDGVRGLREALRSWLEVEEDECRLDHNGNCQNHYIENPCRVAKARALLEKQS